MNTRCTPRYEEDERKKKKMLKNLKKFERIY